MGWALDENAVLSTIQPVFSGVRTALKDLQDAISSDEEIGKLTNAVAALISAIVGLANISFNALPSPLNQTAFWHDFPDDVLELLIYLYLENRHSFLFGVFSFCGVLTK